MCDAESGRGEGGEEVDSNTDTDTNSEADIDVENLHVSFVMPSGLDSSLTNNGDADQGCSASFKNKASVTLESVDASLVVSLGSSDKGGDRPSPLMTIKTPAADPFSATDSENSIPRPPALLSVSTGAFRAAGVEYSSSSKKKRHKGVLENLKDSFQKSLVGRILSGRSSSTRDKEGSGPSTTSSTIRSKGGDLPSLGADENPKQFDRQPTSDSQASAKARRVSNLLWDLGSTWHGCSKMDLTSSYGEGDFDTWHGCSKMDLTSSDRGESIFNNGPRGFRGSFTIPRLQSVRHPQRNMSLYDPKSLEKITEAEEAKEKSRARRELFEALCNARLCVAFFVLVAVIVGVMVGGMALAWKSNVALAAAPAVDDFIDGGLGGRDRQREKDKGFDEFDVVAKLEAKCAEANILQRNGYKACHDLCELHYCCFLEDWDSTSCATSTWEHCPAYKKHCSILDSTGPNMGASFQQGEEEVVPRKEELASVEGHGQGDDATENEVSDKGEGRVPPLLEISNQPGVGVVSYDTRGNALAQSRDEDRG